MAKKQTLPEWMLHMFSRALDRKTVEYAQAEVDRKCRKSVKYWAAYSAWSAKHDAWLENNPPPNQRDEQSRRDRVYRIERNARQERADVILKRAEAGELTAAELLKLVEAF